jgi:hypothetical protein
MLQDQNRGLTGNPGDLAKDELISYQVAVDCDLTTRK